MLTVLDYEQIFSIERAREHPVVDAFERRMGAALDRRQLERAARILACPLKANPPNWQHGRILYAVARSYVQRHQDEHLRFLDVGTAKGFSALCLQWALGEANGEVISVDVIDPNARVQRNSVFEQDGFKTLAEFLAPWPEASAITFERSTGVNWLKYHHQRIHVAFVDGKHQSDVVATEGRLLAARQERGDLVLFDDLQISGVFSAVFTLQDFYALEMIDLQPEANRIYGLGVRR